MTFSRVRVIVIGGGPAGIAAAVAAAQSGGSVVLVEREKRLGGKLKQAIHSGYGFLRFDDALAGPEYVYNDISALEQSNVIVLLQTSILNISRIDNTFQLTISNNHGIAVIEASAVVLATGCREKTFTETGLFGTTPSGVFSAGTCQYYMNIKGQLPTHRCVILGSDNLSLCVAERLHLSGAKVLGVYERTATPRGYYSYVNNCLFDHSIPLHFNHTVTRVFGLNRLRAVEVKRTDNHGAPINGTESIVECDAFIHSDGFIPNNELATSLGVPISKKTHGPICDQSRMTQVDGIFSCGNCLHISDLVDYISESGHIAGRYAGNYLARERHLVHINPGNDYLTVTPQYIDCDILYDNAVLFLTSDKEVRNAIVHVIADGTEVFSQEYDLLRIHETQRIEVDFAANLTPDSNITVKVEKHI